MQSGNRTKPTFPKRLQIQNSNISISIWPQAGISKIIKNERNFTVMYITIKYKLFFQLSLKEIDSLIQNAMARFNVAGIAVAIVKNGKTIHEKGYGVRSITNKLPVDEHTNFQIASNSKAFTTAALSTLVDEGTINRKDKVKQYIPESNI